METTTVSIWPLPQDSRDESCETLSNIWTWDSSDCISSVAPLAEIKCDLVQSSAVICSFTQTLTTLRNSGTSSSEDPPHHSLFIWPLLVTFQIKVLPKMTLSPRTMTTIALKIFSLLQVFPLTSTSRNVLNLIIEQCDVVLKSRLNIPPFKSTPPQFKVQNPVEAESQRKIILFTKLNSRIQFSSLFFLGFVFFPLKSFRNIPFDPN